MKNQLNYRRYRTILIFLVFFFASGCDRDSDEPLTTEKAVAEMQATYDALIAKGVDVPVEWATADIENIGDWEYRILDLPNAATESLQDSLNELGNERWEVFWIENSGNVYRVMLKRPSRSYLNRIPLSQLGQFLIGGSGNEE